MAHVEDIRVEILTETMPPSGGVTDDSIALVIQWLDCEVEQ